MCPLCIGTATLLVSSGASAGGLAALLFRQRARKNRSIALFVDAGDNAILLPSGSLIITTSTFSLIIGLPGSMPIV